MKIEVTSLKEKIETLNTLINRYELVNLNLYNEINKTNMYWKDNQSIKFYKTMNLEKSKSNKIIEELKQIRDLYNYLIYKYEKIGKSVSVNLNEKDSIIYQIDNYSEKLENIINFIEHLDTSFCKEEKIKLDNMKQKLVNEKKYMNNLRNNINDKYKYIISLENEIGEKLTKIDINIIKEINVGDYI